MDFGPIALPWTAHMQDSKIKATHIIHQTPKRKNIEMRELSLRF